VSSIVFEFREADLINLDEAGAAALGALVDLGFNLCVSQLQNFDVEADQLVEGGVRFVKVDAEMLMPAINDDAETARIRRLKRGLDDAGIDLIVSGIANEQLLVELLDFDVEFGQGPLFGDPRKAAPQATATVEGRRGRA
jgi:cyclic-di-GMP phosphodiesterase TipF (flagellum assembly factor)